MTNLALMAAALVAITTNHVETLVNPERGDVKEVQTITTHLFVQDGKTNAVVSTNKALFELKWVEVRPKRVYPTNMWDGMFRGGYSSAITNLDFSTKTNRP